MHHLVCKTEDGEERIYVLDQPITRIGRTRENDILLKGNYVSRRHVEIRIAEGQAMLHDLGSHNGTRVNDKRVKEPLPLRSGDVINIGGSVLLYTYTDASYPVVEDAAMTNPMAAVPEPPPPPESDSSASRSSPADVEDDVAEIYLRFIVRASELLAAPETLQSLLSGLMDLLLEILPADAAALFQLDDRGELHPAVVRIAKWEGAGDPPPPVSQSILRKVLKDKMGWFAPQTAGDKDFNPEKSAAWLPVQSAVCAPLLGEKGVEGMIFLGRGQHYSPFIAKELDLCLALGGQLSGAVSRMKLQEQVRSAAAIRSSLERFIPSEVANRMVSQSGQLGRGLDLEEREVTVLVAKVANYRQLASRLNNLQMARALDVILGELADIVFRYRGTVVAFTQKGMLAVFGAPAAHTTDCDRAFEAALAVQSAGTGSILPELGKIEYGVALAHGIAAAGAIGSQRRLEYVVIGEPVDRARSIARLARPGKILLDQFLLDKLDDCDATPWEAPYTAEGQDPVQIYEVNVRP